MLHDDGLLSDDEIAAVVHLYARLLADKRAAESTLGSGT